MRQGTIVTVAPTAQLLSLSEARQQLQMDPSNTDMDAHITQLCLAAQDRIEGELGFPLAAQTLQTHLEGFPCGAIWLGAGASPSVVSIKYIDASGVQQTLSDTEYALDIVSRPIRVLPALNKSWPSTACCPSAVIVEWRAGFANAAATPRNILHAMKLLVGAWEQNREEGESEQLRQSLDALLRPIQLKFVA